MSVETFITLLFIFSTITSLITEAVKKVVKTKFPIDTVVFCIAGIVGVGGMMSYFILNNIPINENNLIFTCFMVIANALTAMLGYDKVVEAIKQIKEV